MVIKPLAVNAEMSFPLLDFYDRVKVITDLGFRVGLWDIDHLDLAKLTSSDAVFSMCNGFRRGNLVDADASRALIASAEKLIPRVKDLGRPIMNIHGAKLSSEGPAEHAVHEVNPEGRRNAGDTLSRLADLGEKHDIDFTVENLNPLDHPGVPLSNALDLLPIIRDVGSDRVLLNLDLYHAQKDGGNLASLLEACFGLVGEIQVADVPMRNVPGGEGEVNYDFIASEMARLGYTCSVALEAYAPGDSRAELERYRTIFQHFHSLVRAGEGAHPSRADP